MKRMKFCFRTVFLVLLSTTLNASSATFPFPSGTPIGLIEDANCSIEDLEQANDSQLYEILQHLKRTTFFRNFRVDLKHHCPLQSWRKDTDSDQQEEGCTGGADELDEGAEPLCTVEATPAAIDSNALNFLSSAGFESKAQQDTFSWIDVTDQVYTEVEDVEPFSEDDLLPDSFWNDMCSSIGQGHGTSTVNLALNPERNTQYNGTHIWKAIYEENCIYEKCLEERVLYKLLSGLHTSTTLSIAMNYYPPSKRKNRTSWEPNPDYFMEKFANYPERIRNLHFSYVVMLRALRKASSFLYDYEIPDNDEENARKLLQRLLDSSILSNVFSAFDERQLFNSDADNLKQNFKGIFHNVSSILDCVQCQQCKLHGKLAMTGYGAALKVLFMEVPRLNDNEIVGFINTIVKLSESIRHVRELTDLYWKKHPTLGHTNKTTTVTPTTTLPAPDAADAVDLAVGAVAALGRTSRISWPQEHELVQHALSKHPELLILAKHYGTNLDKFFELLQTSTNLLVATESIPDAIVIGSGLAGLSATLNLLDRGGRVILIEKEHLLGGNSNKASSGINACCFEETTDDSIDVFVNDTTRSAGSSANLDLIVPLVSKSADAVSWLRNRAGVDLSLVSQLGGHSAKRTHRPNNGMVGAEIIYNIQKAVKKFAKTGQVTILTDTRVTKLLTDDSGRVVGVECIGTNDNGRSSPQELYAVNTVLATGGFASDRRQGSYLDQNRPELLKMPTTAGPFSTGDGITLAKSLGAGTVDLDKVQVHPTGWVDPADPDNTNKMLAAELMRGVGGILLNDKGERFCNELGTRAYVTHKMLEHDANYAKTGEWNLNATVPTFALVLSSAAAAGGSKHIDLYSHKRLLTRFEGVDALAEGMGLSKAAVARTLKKYQKHAAAGRDDFDKTTFQGVPATDLNTEVFYAGRVTPVLHYCMGGITIDAKGNVLNENGDIIPGLHAAGEVSGGVHGENRLAGNSLLECTVYGTIVGQKLPIQTTTLTSPSSPKGVERESKPATLRKVSKAELEAHNSPDDCWVAIHGIVYDLTEFAEEHPAGPDSIRDLAGKDGTEAFAAVHNKGLLDDFGEEAIGEYDAQADGNEGSCTESFKVVNEFGP